MVRQKHNIKGKKESQQCTENINMPTAATKMWIDINGEEKKVVQLCNVRCALLSDTQGMKWDFESNMSNFSTSFFFGVMTFIYQAKLPPSSFIVTGERVVKAELQFTNDCCSVLSKILEDYRRNLRLKIAGAKTWKSFLYFFLSNFTPQQFSQNNSSYINPEQEQPQIDLCCCCGCKLSSSLIERLKSMLQGLMEVDHVVVVATYKNNV